MISYILSSKNSNTIRVVGKYNNEIMHYYIEKVEDNKLGERKNDKNITVRA